MAYFSNGTEARLYEARYCQRCVHNNGCTVWLAHFLHNYDLCNKPDDPGKQILDVLIPMDGLYTGKCTMFVESKSVRRGD